MTKLAEPVHLDLEFTAPIGGDVECETWSCVEAPAAAGLFGTTTSVRSMRRSTTSNSRSSAWC